jgi:hypothetical protein
LNCSKKVKSEH